MQRTTTYLLSAVVIVVIVVGIGAGLYLTNKPAPAVTNSTTGAAASTSIQTSSKVIQVVDAENFWGSLISQLGRTHVTVTCIVQDSNTDPHEYQINPGNARTISDAQFVIVN